jgi:hypothetical protein
MLEYAGTPGSDDWLLLDLATEMGANFRRLGNLRRYRNGDAPVPDEATPAMRAAYVKFVKMSRLNMCELIVGSKVNRQKVNGFRTTQVGDDLGDTEASRTWDRSRMKVGSRTLFSDAGHYGSSFITVHGPEGEGNIDRSLFEPVMVTSDPWKTWTRAHPLRWWETEYAIDVSHDPIAQVDRIILYGPGWATRAQRPALTKSTIPSDGQLWRPNTDWEWLGPRIILGWTGENPVTRYQTLTGLGIYEPHLDTVDRINDGIKQRVTLTAMQAFKQRALEGNLPTHYPADYDDAELAGTPVDYDAVFEAGPAALWRLPEGVKIWESTVTDIRPLLEANSDDKKDLASVTGTPLYILSPDAASGSAEGATTLKETAIFSVEEMNDLAEVAIAQAMAQTFQAKGDLVRGKAESIGVIWGSVDRMSVSEAMQAMSQGGRKVTQRYADQTILGLTPGQMRQAEADRENEALLQGIEA